jgi:predicted mannosyl-3-phosphoglycerate phosphatase (HAD superfamily)
MKGLDAMLNSFSVSGVLNSLVPISRFNKGEANKIFEEVRETGFKIVLKNNSPIYGMQWRILKNLTIPNGCR